MQNIPLPVVSNLIQIPQPQRLGNNITEDDVVEAYEYAQKIRKMKSVGQPTVTNVDLSEALVYFHKITTAMSGQVQPLWFIPIQQQLTQIQQDLQQIQQDVHLVQQNQQQIQQIQHQIQQDVQLVQQQIQQDVFDLFTNFEIRFECRRYNRGLNRNDALRPMPDLNGNYPQNFPQTISDVQALNNDQADALLQFYGLVPENLLKNKVLQIMEYLK
jgi:hypothetical protein